MVFAGKDARLKSRDLNDAHFLDGYVKVTHEDIAPSNTPPVERERLLDPTEFKLSRHDVLR